MKVELITNGAPGIGLRGDILDVVPYPRYEKTHYKVIKTDRGVKISLTKPINEDNTIINEFNFALIAVGS